MRPFFYSFSFPTLFLLVLALSAKAQTHFCGQPEVMESFFHRHPEARAAFEQQTSGIRAVKRTDAKSGTAGVEYRIPVVFHILHQNGSENISDAQVRDQIRILNRDYQRQNPDTGAVVTPFRDNIANVGFGFELARIDPDGKCTNGIVRHLTSRTNWDANNFSYFAYSWPRDKYLNIYVVKTLNITATAYTFLPGLPIQPNEDCIVTMHNMVGSIGTGTVANSRVLTHEVGHWFGLQHIWGTTNTPGVVCGDDLVDDTPETKGFITCNTQNNGICNPGIRENVQNYMDYAPCKIMFTNGQADRMRSFMVGSINNRQNLWSEENLLETGISGQVVACLPKVEIISNRKTVCPGQTVRYRALINPGPASYTRSWTFPGGNPASSADSIVDVVYADTGTYNVSLSATNPTGTTNQLENAYIRVSAVGPLRNLPFSEDFEGQNLPEGFSIQNGNPLSLAWAPFTGAGAAGSSQSFSMQSYSDFSNAPGERDALELPDLDFSNQSGLNFSYYYAYARPVASQRDSFKVQYSLDCGGNWTTFPGIPTIGQMAGASGGSQTGDFTPTPGQWAQVNVPAASLAPLENQGRVRIRFLFVRDIAQGQANNVYIDQISAGAVTSVRPMQANRPEFFLHHKGNAIHIGVGAIPATDPVFGLWDGLGKEVAVQSQQAGEGRWILNPKTVLPAGRYYVQSRRFPEWGPKPVLVF